MAKPIMRGKSSLGHFASLQGRSGKPKTSLGHFASLQERARKKSMPKKRLR